MGIHCLATKSIDSVSQITLGNGNEQSMIDYKCVEDYPVKLKQLVEEKLNQLSKGEGRDELKIWFWPKTIHEDVMYEGTYKVVQHNGEWYLVIRLHNEDIPYYPAPQIILGKV